MACCPLFIALHSQKQRGPKTHDKQFGNRRIPPKPTKRKRALTLPLDDGSIVSWAKRRKTSEQFQTGFFRLPYELRVKIYEEYFGREQLYMTFENKVLQSYRRSHAEFKVDVIPLLQTCRKLYTEGIGLLYSMPTYVFHNPLAFLSFYSCILPQRSRTIRSLILDFNQNNDLFTPQTGLNFSHILSQYKVRTLLPAPDTSNTRPDYWHIILKVLHEMQSLRKLVVRIADQGRASDTRWNDDVVKKELLDAFDVRGVDLLVWIEGETTREWLWSARKKEERWLMSDGGVYIWTGPFGDRTYSESRADKLESLSLP